MAAEIGDDLFRPLSGNDVVISTRVPPVIGRSNAFGRDIEQLCEAREQHGEYDDRGPADPGRSVILGNQRVIGQRGRPGAERDARKQYDIKGRTRGRRGQAPFPGEGIAHKR